VPDATGPRRQPDRSDLTARSAQEVRELLTVEQLMSATVIGQWVEWEGLRRRSRTGVRCHSRGFWALLLIPGVNHEVPPDRGGIGL